MKANIFEEYRWRGLVFEHTEGAQDPLSHGENLTAYVGFDPTADSLHIGNLLTIMGLLFLQRHGHTPIALIGGATGMVGDPSGKSKERNLLGPERLAHNVSCIRAQLERFLDVDAPKNPAKIKNNADWLGPLGFIEFMRDVGKHFPVNTMLGKESVKRRLECGGISYTEFSYMLLQAYDFLQLHTQDQCTLQLGGSDQWGNITAGTELIRRVTGQKVHGLVFPLITSANGEKFGKTADGAVWLDPKRTSPYKFYQFWLNVSDSDAIRFLKCFTLLDEEEIEAISVEHAKAPHKRLAQRHLADDVTRRVHGDLLLVQAQCASEAMFGGEVCQLSGDEISEVFADVPSVELSRDYISSDQCNISDLLVKGEVCKSKGEARRLIVGGGVKINDVKIEDPYASVDLDQSIEGRFMVIKRGKKSYHLIRLTD